jgi:transcriptional regulator with XRE-family HTH domain
MKQTPEDRQFAKLFAQALQPYVDRDLRRGESMARIGARLGVTGPGLQKYLDGGTVPSLRTVVRAYLEYKVSVPYEGFDIARSAAARWKRREPAEQQLLLPFHITAPSPKERLTLKLEPTGVRRYQLQVTLRVAQ